MKKFLTIVCLLCVIVSNAQVKVKTAITTSLLSTDPDQLRTENGLISHRVSGSVGSFGATDQWIGIGQPIASGVPLTNLYGSRIQWNQQALNVSLRQAAAAKNALIEWGNQGGEMQLRYITNPLDSNGFTKILNLTSAGNAYIGNQNSGNFTNPKFEINPQTSGQLALAVNTTGLLGSSFRHISTNTDGNAAAPALNLQVTPASGAARTDGVVISASGANNNIGLISNGSAPVGSNFSLGIQGAASGVQYQTGIGVAGDASGANSSNTGVKGTATSTGNGNAYGVFGTASASSGVTMVIGVYGNVTGTAGLRYAGYFNGNVFTTGTYTTSDQKLKDNVNDESGAMAKLKLLRPVSYNFKLKEFPELNLPKEFQHGLIAQELEKVFPEMVGITKDIVTDKNGQPVVKGDIKVVNYTMLIPVMIKAMQEQQDKISQLEKKIAQAQASDSRIAAGSFTDLSSPMLAQNTPNPFSGSTVIRYNIPAKYSGASLGVFDMTGKTLLTYGNLNGQGQVTVNAQNLPAGIYLYSLYKGTEEILSKKMVVSK